MSQIGGKLISGGHGSGNQPQQVYMSNQHAQMQHAQGQQMTVSGAHGRISGHMIQHQQGQSNVQQLQSQAAGMLRIGGMNQQQPQSQGQQQQGYQQTQGGYMQSQQMYGSSLSQQQMSMMQQHQMHQKTGGQQGTQMWSNQQQQQQSQQGTQMWSNQQQQ